MSWIISVDKSYTKNDLCERLSVVDDYIIEIILSGGSII